MLMARKFISTFLLATT
ncbi:hypothetical protein Pint_25727 [Pistacia integerrima]|uniref:Uncharacterized protein n=1 Tax=Pistacia integerrima TaxID=434235 RepID=A0ACC0YCK9_9ROSI|nr:hypothetical protein Pint_25727 [Pistacia integerrima]